MFSERIWWRWGLAAVVFAIATVLNLWLQPIVDGRIPLLPYFPALVVVGLYAGFLPALALLVVAGLAVLFFWIPPIGSVWPIDSVSDTVVILSFALAGSAVAYTSALARRLMAGERRLRDRLNRALTTGRMVAWDWDVGADQLVTSSNAVAVFGRRWGRMRHFLRSVHADDRPALRQAFREAARGAGALRVLCRVVAPETGMHVWAQTDAHIVRSDAGAPSRVSGVTLEVTALQEALLASRAAEQRFHLALQSGKVMAWECDRAGRYTWVFNTLLNVPRDDLVGSVVGASVAEPGYLDIVRRAVATGEPSTHARSVQRDGQRDGQRYHLLTSLRPVREADGRVHRLLGATVDVTELTAAQEQLRVENERKDAFLATLAHELRNPMAPIRYAAATLRKSTLPEQRDRAVDIITRQSAHMARLLDDLLDMSRITRDSIELRRQVVDLRVVVQHAIEAVEPLYRDARHRLDVSVPDGPVQVNGDPTRLQQVLGNLLDNAAKYSPGPGEVTVRVAVEAGRAQVSVQDTGIGIAPDQQGKVFELFTRVHGAGRGPAGLGIGLAVARQLMHLHGGALEVHSAGIGQGSRFTLSLILASEAAERPDEPGGVEEGPAIAARGVLVVDDNVDAADSLAEVLQASGHVAFVAYTGEEAILRYEVLRPSVVLLDIGLPGLSGLQVAQRLRARAGPAELSLVAVTGWGQSKDREQTQRAGFDAHLVKPVAFDELNRVLDGLLRRRAVDAGPP